MEAVNSCEKMAYDYGNQEIEQEHLLLALLQQQDGLISKLIEKMEIDLTYFTNDAVAMVENRTKVSGGGQVFVGKDLNNVLIHAEDEKEQNKGVKRQMFLRSRVFDVILDNPVGKIDQVFQDILFLVRFHFNFT